MHFNIYHLIFLEVLFLAGMCQKPTANNRPLKIACAANMQFVMEEWVETFENTRDYKIELTISSSGKLFAQLREGAPWDLFFSADEKYPRELHQFGLGVKGPTPYAIGRLIYLSRRHQGCPSFDLYLKKPCGKIAIANHKTAPYGQASRVFLENIGALDKIKDYIVYGESISQVNRFFMSGSIQQVITSQSLVYTDKFNHTLDFQYLPDSSYTKISQSYLQLTHHKALDEFLQFIQSVEGKSILHKFGYQ
jgi:molybdate transport system substrate-binding protein